MNTGIECEIFWSEIGSTSGVPPSSGSKRSSLYFSLCSNHNRQQNKSRHFALKGLSDVLLTSKGENKAFPSPIPSMQCCAAVRATYRRQQIPTLLNLERRRGGRGSLRGRRIKGRERGREKSTPSLFAFFPIPYPFRRLLRRLGEGCGFFCSLKLPYMSTMSQQFCRRL